MSNIAWVLLALAGCWILQLALTWRQARRFMAAVSAMRKQTGGRVTVGMGKHRLRKAYVALAVEGVTVTRALVLRGATVLADATPEPRLTGGRVTELARGRVARELPEAVRAAAIQAAGFLSTKDVAIAGAAGLAPGGRRRSGWLRGFDRRPARPVVAASTKDRAARAG